MIALAAVIAGATAVGVALERRFPEGADRAARRAMWLMLWVLLPVVAFFNIAALELTARVGAGIGFGYAALLLVFLILVGMTLASVAGAGKRGFPPLTLPIAAALLVKLALAPATVLALSETVIVVPDSYLSQAAMAGAINSIVVADQYGLDRALVAAAIAWSTAIVVTAGLVIEFV